jgi:hypothetical protein
MPPAFTLLHTASNGFDQAGNLWPTRLSRCLLSTLTPSRYAPRSRTTHPLRIHLVLIHNELLTQVANYPFTTLIPNLGVCDLTRFADVGGAWANIEPLSDRYLAFS